MDYYQSFASIKDGLSALSDKEIFQQATETPKNFKDSLKSFNKKLEKYDLKLLKNGTVKNFKKKLKKIFKKKLKIILNGHFLNKTSRHSQLRKKK